ncbi:preprotein translocase subunit SecG [Clostridiaceae bacterium OttesenSCG-928-D20]|nr:preprotein translocase subunit SecG [Clostridiaceae bacterium OttesenSCG-928-D20]
MTIFLTIIQVIFCILIITIVLFQSGKRSGLSGAVAGGAETFMSKGKAKSLDAKLAKSTKYIAIAWIILTLVLNLI